MEHLKDLKETIKVLVVDDSALMRKMIPMIVSSDKNIEVIGTAVDGDFALQKIPKLKPDVITLDVDMPRMDGLTALKSIVRDFGIPVIIVSSLSREGAEVTLKGLEIGAFDFVPKPQEAISAHISEISHQLIDKIRAAAHYKPLSPKELPHVKTMPQARIISDLWSTTAESVVAIGISTGGPKALTEMLPLIPNSFPASLLIVQHMPEGFTDFFAKRLNAACSISVKEAADGDIIKPGTAFIAPGGRHLKLKRSPYGMVSVLSLSPPVSGHRPSATVLFDSVAEEYGEDAIGIIMTGMGDDGVEGIRHIKERGGVTIAQDKETSTVYGMPKIAVERGYADMVLSLDDITLNLIRMAQQSEWHNKRSYNGKIHDS